MSLLERVLLLTFAVSRRVGAASTLREAAEGYIYMGTELNPAHFSEANYSETARREYSLATAENECKWAAIEPEQNIFTFDKCDEVLNFTVNAGAAFRGHNLCWGENNPAWLEALAPKDKKSALVNHISATLAHYQTASADGGGARSLAVAWDVVNEALDDHSTADDWFYKNSTWFPDVPDFVSDAFFAARAACPACKLFYNDYGIASSAGSGAPKAGAVVAMLQQLLAEGVPIDGVGFQLHVSESFSEEEIAGVSDNIAKVGALGLEIHFTEIDVSCGSWPTYSCPAWGEDQQDQQAAVYRGLLEACLGATSICTSFETWGFTDKYSKKERPYPSPPLPSPCCMMILCAAK